MLWQLAPSPGFRCRQIVCLHCFVHTAAHITEFIFKNIGEESNLWERLHAFRFAKVKIILKYIFIGEQRFEIAKPKWFNLFCMRPVYQKIWFPVNEEKLASNHHLLNIKCMHSDLTKDDQERVWEGPQHEPYGNILYTNNFSIIMVQAFLQN